MKIQPVQQQYRKPSFQSLRISASVLGLKPENQEKLRVVRDTACKRPDIDFTVESDYEGDLQVTIQKAHPLDMLLACGMIQFNSREHHLINFVKAAQQKHDYIYDVKPKTYKETIPAEVTNDETAFILDDMVDILYEEIDKPEAN